MYMQKILVNPLYRYYFLTSPRIIIPHVKDYHFPAGLVFPKVEELDALYWTKDGIYNNLDTYRFPNLKKINFDGNYSGPIVRYLSRFEQVVIPQRMNEMYFCKENLKRMDSSKFDEMYHGLNLTYYNLQFEALLEEEKSNNLL